MIQPIDRETAIALAKEAGKDTDFTKHIELWTPDTWQFTERLCNLAVAHSRKDAEPGAWQYRMKPEWHDAWVKWQPCEKANFDDYVKAPVINGWQFEARALFTHPPEADKLLKDAQEDLKLLARLANVDHSERPCITAIRTYLENKNA